jgi:hypothetical protein
LVSVDPSQRVAGKAVDEVLARIEHRSGGNLPSEFAVRTLRDERDRH